MIQFLHFDIKIAPRISRYKDIKNNLFTLWYTKTNRFVKDKFNSPNLVITFKTKYAIKKILQRILAVKKFLKSGFISRVKIYLSRKRLGNRFLTNYFVTLFHAFFYAIFMPAKKGFFERKKRNFYDREKVINRLISD